MTKDVKSQEGYVELFLPTALTSYNFLNTTHFYFPKDMLQRITEKIAYGKMLIVKRDTVNCSFLQRSIPTPQLCRLYGPLTPGYETLKYRSLPLTFPTYSHGGAPIYRPTHTAGKYTWVVYATSPYLDSNPGRGKMGMSTSQCTRNTPPERQKRKR